jgi:DNA-binding transcriptional LysR family regulator
MRNLNLDQLRSLIEVVELGSFTEAAKRLHLTQPAISLQIRELENRCGLQLVERDGRRVFATPAGRELILHGRRIMADAEHALVAVRHHKEGTAGRVHIGTGPSALIYLLPPVLRKVRDTHPNIEMVVTTGTTHSISAALLTNEIDIGFTALPVEAKDLDAVPVRHDPMVAILPSTDHDIPAKMTPADVAGRTLILEYQRVPHRQLSRAWLTAGGVDVRPAMEFDSIEAIKSAVSAGLGMSIVPGPAVSEGPPLNSVVVRPLDPPLLRTLGLVQRRGRAEPPALRIVREAIMTLRSDVVEERQEHRQDDRSSDQTRRRTSISGEPASGRRITC